MNVIDSKLEELQIVLPEVSPPIHSYAPFTVIPSFDGDLVFLSGHLPMSHSHVAYTGKLDNDCDIEQAQAAARLCVVNLLASLKAACQGDLERVILCVRLNGFIQSSEDFDHHSKVMNGASDLILQIFGDKGRHTRSVLGVVSLPLNTTIEIDGIFLIK